MFTCSQFIVALLFASVLSLAAASEFEHPEDEAELEAIPMDDLSELFSDELDYRAFTNPHDPSNRTYGVIVDCGSSGTRAHIYEWDSSLEYEQLLHNIEPMRDSERKPVSRKFSPSLSSFADDKNDQIEAYIQQVLNYLESYIPRSRHPATGIYILATAGMRLLDETQQARIMDVISAYIEHNYHFAKVKTSVISGAHEGMYQWISVNAKAKRFLGQDTDGRTKTYAVVEMGGASIQVTYQLRPGVRQLTSSLLTSQSARQAYDDQVVEPELSHHDKPENTYMLHSTTFLGFGSNSAREAYLDLLIHQHKSHAKWQKFVRWSKNWFAYLKPETKDNERGDERNKHELILDDPCLPEGFVSEELKKPRELLYTKAGGKILGHLLEEDQPSFSYKVRGTGSYSRCKRMVNEMLRLAKKERLNCKNDGSSCTMDLIGESFIPFESLDILGIGDIYYTTSLMLRAAGVYNHKTIIQKTKTICNTPYAKLITQFDYIYTNEKLRSRVSDECFKAIWVDTFLMKGLRLPKKAKTFKTIGKINDDDLEWTLGAVLDKSLAIEEAAEVMTERMYNSSSGSTTTTTTTTIAEPSTELNDLVLPAEVDA